MKRLHQWFFVLVFALSGTARAAEGGRAPLVIDPNGFIQLGGPNAPSTPAGASGPTMTTTGTVYDPSGAPAAGVKLHILRSGRLSGRGWMTNLTTSTDANGKYSLQWPSPVMGGSPAEIPGIVSILIAHDPARNLAAARYLDATNPNADLRLSEGLSLSGSVKDAGGKPLNGCKVKLNLTDDNYNYTLDQGVTDADGSFHFRGLPQQEGYLVYVVSSGYGNATGTVTPLKTHTNHYAFPDFVIKKADRKLAGYVLDGNAKFLAGASVFFSGEGQPSLPTVTTDPKGHFAFDGVCEGQVKVFVTIPGTALGHKSKASTVEDARGGDTNLVFKVGDTQPDGEAR
jgi:5-hydroxyisourate hydrolase-like protein (transthyretin family)